METGHTASQRAKGDIRWKKKKKEEVKRHKKVIRTDQRHDRWSGTLNTCRQNLLKMTTERSSDGRDDGKLGTDVCQVGECYVPGMQWHDFQCNKNKTTCSMDQIKNTPSIFSCREVRSSPEITDYKVLYPHKTGLNLLGSAYMDTVKDVGNWSWETVSLVLLTLLSRSWNTTLPFLHV